MYTTYAIEKIVADHQREARAAAAQRALAREVRCTTPRPDASGLAVASGHAIRFPRPRRWFGLSALGR